MEDFTLGRYLAERDENYDEDIYVDGIDCIAVCGRPKFTEEGKRYFKDALDLKMDGRCVVGTNEDQKVLYEYKMEFRKDAGRLGLAWELLMALAGYCSDRNYNRWFSE